MLDLSSSALLCHLPTAALAAARQLRRLSVRIGSLPRYIVDAVPVTVADVDSSILLLPHLELLRWGARQYTEGVAAHLAARAPQLRIEYLD